MGNINDEPLSKIYNSEKFISFRKILASNNFEKYPKTCEYCQKYYESVEKED